MALCNIVGDACYLGYAFDSVGLVSTPKLIGALLAFAAHIVVLAYGDDMAVKVAVEQGTVSHIVLKLRTVAQNLATHLPLTIASAVRKKPVGWPFLLLAMNGLGLALDALMEFSREGMGWQLLSGILITLGCSGFAWADFAKGQKAANRLTKLAPSILLVATASNAGLSAATLNPFIFVGLVVFTLSNFAGFFTHIDKEEGQHLHS